MLNTKIQICNPTPSVPTPHAPTPSNDIAQIHPDLCLLCSKTVSWTDLGLLCSHCNRWSHSKCNNLSFEEYYQHELNPEKEFICKKCRKCNICNLTIGKNHLFQPCCLCHNISHIKCNKFSSKEHKERLRIFTALNVRSVYFRSQSSVIPNLTLMSLKGF